MSDRKPRPETIQDAFHIWFSQPFPSRAANITLHSAIVAVLAASALVMPTIVPDHPGYGDATVPIVVLIVLVGALFSFTLSWQRHFAPTKPDPPRLPPREYEHVAERTMKLWAHHESTRRAWLAIFVATHVLGIGVLQWLHEHRGNDASAWFAALFVVTLLLAAITLAAHTTMTSTLLTLHASARLLREAETDSQLQDYYRRVMPKRPLYASTMILTYALTIPAVLWSFTSLLFFLVVLLL